MISVYPYRVTTDFPTFRAELSNVITHGFGFLASVAGLVLLVVYAGLYGGAREITASALYGASLVVLYLASTVYHSVRTPRARKITRIIDHVAIYVLIAGTYTPFALITLRGTWGWSLFGVAWGLALLGVIYEIFFCGRFKIFSVLVYLGMGWMVIFAIKPLVSSLPLAGVLWLAAGGLAYSLGTIFYAWKSLPHHHAIWHLFVLGGSVCHYVAVLCYVLPYSGPGAGHL